MTCRIAMVAAALVAAAGLVSAQPKGGPGASKGGGYKPPEGPAPKTPWGTPDINGVWQRPYVPDIERSVGKLPFTEWGKQQWESYNPEEGDYTGSCLPFGHVRSINSPDPIQLVQTPTHLAFLYEQNSWFKILPIDGRPQKKKVPTWFGDSAGHWDGDTLVVETTNFNGLTRLDTVGHPHSNELKVTERFTRTDAGHLAYQMTLDDPKTYTKPLVSNRTFTLRTDWEILEYSCEENNRGLIEGRIKFPDYDGGAKK
ncbi:MAG: hypothetical protein JO307_30885 [Bryobacterales bacterium]|nr:hypothetical protein [Bryobacterales bacterium]